MKRIDQLKKSCRIFCLPFVAVCFLPYTVQAKKILNYPQPASFSEIQMSGELQQRLSKNFSRLEDTRYQPDNVFLTMEQSGDWPGDTEGRTILGLVLDAQAGKMAPKYLEEIIRRIPAHLNAKGYMGPIYTDYLHEQQLSGNGWMLRGLCEYYLWEHDADVLKEIRMMACNLFLPGKGHYAEYPILPQERKKNVGAESGSIAQRQGFWQLSSDIGCVFIGMDGLIQAYGVLKDATEQGVLKNTPQNSVELAGMRSVIEEMIHRFLQMDLVGIKAQTHATLTACRGLLRYADISGDKSLVGEVEKRFGLYMKDGMTENYENYNWFDRFNTWTEPCAIVDSYLLAVQLWQHTGKGEYLEQAELIYWNALCRTQRRNGGFGCDNCPGEASQTPLLKVHAPEAYWCCTMRGGEGLSRAAQYSCFKQGKEVFLTSYRESELNLKLGAGENFQLKISTKYPMEGKTVIWVKENNAGKVSLHLPLPLWIQHPEMKLNGALQHVLVKDGFLVLSHKFRPGDKLELTFGMFLGFRSSLNKKNTVSGARRAFYGLLELSYAGKTLTIPQDAKLEREGLADFHVSGTSITLSPVYHMMSPDVWEKTSPGVQILF